MLDYYKLKMKLLYYAWRSTRLTRKQLVTDAKLKSLQTLIAAGFTSEKEFENFNKRLIDNKHKGELPPPAKKAIERARNEYHKHWKPKKHFKDSRDRQAQSEAKQREKERTEFVRVLKNRPPKPNPDDLVNPQTIRQQPIGDKKEGQ